MKTCTTPPSGWKCSRESGHDGPCAARQDFPYDEYADKVLNGLLKWQNVSEVNGEIVFSESCVGNLSVRELRNMLTDAWLDGLAHSLEILEKK